MIMEKEYKLRKKRFSNRGKSFVALFLLFSLTLLTLLLIVNGSQAAVSNFERVSIGTNGLQGNNDSFFISLSDDAKVAAFESFASNWATDQSGLNFVDIFVRDLVDNTTTKITFGPSGAVANQRSFDPIVSADGRYVSFTSYASNLVPDDTNRHIFDDDGLDVFLYDRVTGTLKRVTLDWEGEQIDANSVGRITGDARYVVFVSNGLEVVQNDFSYNKSAIYIRDLQTGTIERITKGAGNAFPNGNLEGVDTSYDGRYIIYLSDASNIVPDTNGLRDVMLYDRNSGQTTLVSKPAEGGQANGISSPAHITPDGRYIVFRSYASNLVPGDINGKSDIFLYDTMTEEIELVSISSSGVQGNGDSKDPAICGSGRFISFTSEATNLVSLPHNGERQIYVHDRVTRTTFLATGTDTFMGNGRAHRSTLSNDCSTIGFATEASNIVSGDTNGFRDLFIGDVVIPVNLDLSTVTATGGFEPGSVVTYTFTLKNIGTETAVVDFDSPIPANTTYVSGSVTGAGASYNGGENSVQWMGNLPGEDEQVISYAVLVDPGLVDFTLILNQTDVIFGANNQQLAYVFAVNGLKTYLPIVHR